MQMRSSVSGGLVLAAAAAAAAAAAFTLAVLHTSADRQRVVGYTGTLRLYSVKWRLQAIKPCMLSSAPACSSSSSTAVSPAQHYLQLSFPQLLAR
jgi:hypothetical protein